MKRLIEPPNVISEPHDTLPLPSKARLAGAPGSAVSSRAVATMSAEESSPVTWAPGQRDVQHSHPAAAVYYPMECTLRQYGGEQKGACYHLFLHQETPTVCQVLGATGLMP